MRSNKFVYPSLQFKNLGKNHRAYKLAGRGFVDFKKIKSLVRKLDYPKVIFQGHSKAEKILSIFLSDEIIFGPEKYIIKNRKDWIKSLEYFTAQNKPVQFSILGFPFKVPCPLKTDRILPDMGEILALRRLMTIVSLIKKIYRPGAKITVFTEESFAKFARLPEFEAKSYQIELVKLVKKLGYQKELKIISLARMEKFKNFKNLYNNFLVQNKAKMRKKEKQTVQAYEEASPSIEKIINSRKYKIAFLEDVFNPKLKNPNNLVLKIRKDLKKRAKKAFLLYFSYLQTKNQINFITKTIGPNLPLTVSPKENRLGIIPVDKRIRILPYHGVTVYFPKKNKFDVKYLIDLKNSSSKLKPVFLYDDKDLHPFYYEFLN